MKGPQMKLRQATAALTVAGVLVTSAAGAAGWSPREWFSRQDSASPGVAATAVAAAPGPVALATAPNYRAIVERFGPAVVGINTEGTMKTAGRGDNDDAPFSQFFRGMPGRGGVRLGDDRGHGPGDRPVVAARVAEREPRRAGGGEGRDRPRRRRHRDRRAPVGRQPHVDPGRLRARARATKRECKREITIEFSLPCYFDDIEAGRRFAHL